MNIWLSEIWRAWRASLRRPGFLLLAVGVLALGIRASAAVFTLIDQVLMQPLPISNASRVVVMGPSYHGAAGFLSARQYRHLQHMDGVASTGLVHFGPPVNISGDGKPEVVPASYINRGVLPVFGLHPILGRNFTAKEAVPHGPHVVMLGYGFWERRYGGDKSVLGQTLEVKGSAYTIVGVLPKSFNEMLVGDVVMPFALPPHSTYGLNYMAVARLAPGSSLQSVIAEINTRMHSMYLAMTGYQYRDTWLHRHFTAQPYKAWVHTGVGSTLALFMACALGVLLIAMVNLINLMLVRSLSRVHDNAVRDALGARSLRRVLPALAEGLLIGVAGALVGTGAAMLGLHVLEGSMSANWLPDDGIDMPAWMWLLAAGVAILVALCAAAFGVWRSQRTATIDELREGGRSGLGRHSGLLGRALVMAQMLLATVLLCSTGLLLHGMYRAAHIPLGFAADVPMLTFDLTPVQADYPDARSVNVLSQRLVRQLQAIPGVTAAVATTNLPTDSRGERFNIGGIHKPGGTTSAEQYRGVGPAFFKLFDIKVLRGRAISKDDVRGGASVAIVNRALAEKMYAGHALGKFIQGGGDSYPPWSARIVGIVGNTRPFGPFQPAPGILYVPLAQIPDRIMGAFRHYYSLHFVLRGDGNPHQWRSAVETVMSQVAPDQPISHFRTMDKIVRSTTSRTRSTLLLISIFAALALLLAAAGLYAVMTVAVAAREREFGVRVALGAEPARLIWLVMRGGFIQIATGLVIGVGIVLAASGVLTGLLMQLTNRGSSFDLVALVGASVVLVITGLSACLIPALRAAHVQPMHALRGE